MASRETENQKNRIEKLRKEMPWYIDEYIDSKEDIKSPATLVQYLHDFKKFLNWILAEGIVNCEQISDIPLSTLENIKLADAKNYIKFLRRENIHINKGEYKQRNPNSVIRKIQSLKALYKYLTMETEDENGECYFYRNVMSKIEVQKAKVSANSRAQQISTKILHGPDIQLFLSFIANDYIHTIEGSKRKGYFLRDKERDIAIFSMFLGSGLRVSELANLSLDSIDFKNAKIDITRKGNKQDNVDVLPAALDDLNEYLKIRKERYKVTDQEQYVFLTIYQGSARPIAVRSIQNLVEKYTKEFNKKMSPHKLRHTFAGDWIRNGGNLVKLRDQLGHNSIETTALYTNLGSKESRIILDKMHESRFDEE